FKSFSNAGGLVHQVGSPVVIPAGTSISGGGTIPDPLTVNGTLSAYSTTTGVVVNAGNGIVVNSGGVANLGGVVTINAPPSAINDGAQFSASEVDVGVTQPGLLLFSGNQTSGMGAAVIGKSNQGTATQTGGTVTMGTPPGNGIILGANAGATGTYHLVSG